VELTAEGLAFLALETGLSLGSGAAAAAGHRIARVAELRAIADQLRLHILDVLMSDLDRSWSARALADETGCALNRLHYHLRLLEEQGLVFGSWAASAGRPERRYAATHRHIWFARGGGGQHEPTG
jgi:predicted transcriptional regulator